MSTKTDEITCRDEWHREKGEYADRLDCPTCGHSSEDAPQPQSDERRAALESLLPGRAVNTAQTDWGKGYIEGWLAKSQAKEGE